MGCFSNWSLANACHDALGSALRGSVASVEISAAAFDNIFQLFSLFVENSLAWRLRGRGVARLGFDDGSSSIGTLSATTSEIVPVKPNQKSDGPTEQWYRGVD